MPTRSGRSARWSKRRFSADHIGVLRKGEKDGVHEVRDHGKGAGTGVGTGLVEGGVLGAAAAFVLPAAGPVIGAGILGTIILGAAHPVAPPASSPHPPSPRHPN